MEFPNFCSRFYLIQGNNITDKYVRLLSLLHVRQHLQIVVSNLNKQAYYNFGFFIYKSTTMKGTPAENVLLSSALINLFLFETFCFQEKA